MLLSHVISGNGIVHLIHSLYLTLNRLGFSESASGRGGGGGGEADSVTSLFEGQ